VLFLDLLDRFNQQGQYVSPKPSSTYAPKIFSDHADANGTGKKAFAAAMQRVLDTGTTHFETVGSPSRERTRLVRT
jgi:hypothetical protein